MTTKTKPEPLTLRQLRACILPLTIWGVVTVLAWVAGPFGTFEALKLWPRLIYWALVAGVSVGVSVIVMQASAKVTGWRWMLCWVGFVVLNAGIVHLGNAIIFEAWRGIREFLVLLGNVGLVTVMVHGLIWALNRNNGPEKDTQGVETQNSEEQFLRKLPLERRGPLIRIESQDHYLNVVTHAGEALILMRLSDAIDMLSGVEGVQVHRSHWVCRAAVLRHRKEGGRDVLVMADGTDVPVSRGQKQVARAAGLF